MRCRVLSADSIRRKAVWGPRRIVVVALLAFVPVVSAQGPQQPRPIVGAPIRYEPVRLQPTTRGDGAFMGLRRDSRSVTIHGIVMNHVGNLVPNAGAVVIRRLTDGVAVGQTQVNDMAQFTVSGFEPGVYAAELVDGGGSIIATSGVFNAGVGEIIQLAPVIPATPLSGLAGVMASATDGALKAASSAGITAVSAGVPASP